MESHLEAAFVLGIISDFETVSEHRVKKIYKKKARSLHPDKGGDKAQFDNLTKAYERMLKYIREERGDETEKKWSEVDFIKRRDARAAEAAAQTIKTGKAAIFDHDAYEQHWQEQYRIKHKTAYREIEPGPRKDIAPQRLFDSVPNERDFNTIFDHNMRRLRESDQHQELMFMDQMAPLENFDGGGEMCAFDGDTFQPHEEDELFNRDLGQVPAFDTEIGGFDHVKVPEPRVPDFTAFFKNRTQF